MNINVWTSRTVMYPPDDSYRSSLLCPPNFSHWLSIDRRLSGAPGDRPQFYVPGPRPRADAPRLSLHQSLGVRLAAAPE